MGLKFSHPHQPTMDEIKTPVQSVENPKGFGGVIIYDQKTFTLNNPHLSVTQDENSGEIHPEVSFDNTNSSEVSVQHLNNQEGISEDTLEEATVHLSVQCVENQRGLCGQIVYDDVSNPINLQPQAEPDMDDEGIVIDMEED